MTNPTEFESLASVCRAINAAERVLPAATVFADWCGQQDQPVIVGVLDVTGSLVEVVASPDHTANPDLLHWVRSDPEWRTFTDTQIRAEQMALPLRYNEQTLGVVMVAALSNELLLVAQVLAARLHHLWRSYSWTSKLESINEISLALTQSVGDDLWERLQMQLDELFDTSSFFVALVNPDHAYLEFPLVVEDGIPAHYPPMPSCGLSSAVITYAIPLFFRDLHTETERLAALKVQMCDQEPGEYARSWLGVPLRDRKNEITGVLSIQNTLPDAFTDGDLSLLLTISAQLALALDNAVLMAAERAQRTMSSMLMEVGQMVSSTLHYDDVLEMILERLYRVVNYDSALILLPPANDRTGSRLIVSALQGWSPGLRGVEFTLSGENPLLSAYRSGQPLVLDDAQQHPGWVALGDPDESARIRAWIGVPMVVQDHAIGVIALEKYVPGFYTQRDASTAFALARQAAIAVENARLHDQARVNVATLEQRARRLTSIHYILSIITSSLEQDVVLTSAAQLLTDFFDIDHCVIALEDGPDGALRVAAEYPELDHADYRAGLEAADLMPRLRTEPTGFTVENGAAETVPAALRDLLQHIDAGAALFLPLTIRDRTIGLLALNTISRSHVFTEDERETFMTIAGQVAMAVTNADLYNQAVEANQLKMEFLANISHELRTPLNAINGYSDMLLMDTYGPLNDKQRDRLERVNASGKHLLALINDLLDLSRIEAGRLEFDTTALTVSHIARDTIEDLRLQAEEKQLTLDLQITGDEQPVQGEPDRIRQILINLLDNAIKFTDTGGVTVRVVPVSIWAGEPRGGVVPPAALDVPDGDWMAISVVDSGIGIDPADQRVIFDAFRQADGSPERQYGGTGLGLAITQQLVQMHRGYIWVTSEPGQGSTFTFLLPCAPHATEPAPRDAAADTPTILVVDDDYSILRLVQGYLGDEAYRVIGIDNPTQALQHAVEQQPAAIITDVMMPGMNGWELLRALKHHDATAHIPVIVLSVVDDQTTGYYLGAADYLTKPVDRQTLLDTLSRVLDAPPAAPVLVIDDEADQRDLLTTWLARGGLRAEAVPDGATALRWLGRQPASLIVLDLMLPGMSGFELLAELRRDPFTADIPVVIVTAKQLDVQSRHALDPHIQTILQKAEMTAADLLEQVETALRSRQRPDPRRS